MKAAKAATTTATSAFFMAAMFKSQRFHRNIFRVHLHSCTTDGAEVCMQKAPLYQPYDYLLKTGCCISNWTTFLFVVKSAGAQFTGGDTGTCPLHFSRRAY